MSDENLAIWDSISDGMWAVHLWCICVELQTRIFFIKNTSPLLLLTTKKSNHSYLLYKEMIKFGPDYYEKKTCFQMSMTSAGFGVSLTSYRALVAEGIVTMGSFLPMEAKCS